MTKANIGRKTTRDKWDGMVMGATGRGDYFRFVKKKLVFGEDEL
jgi:hypothetical protein